jgi:hypothetical protein
MSEIMEGEETRAYVSAEIDGGGLPGSETTPRLLLRTSSKTGSNSGAMVGLPWALGLIDKRLVGWLVPSLLLLGG